MKSATKRFALVLSLLILSVIAKGYLSKKPEQEKRLLKIAVMDWSGFYPVIVAQKKEIFKKHQIEVELINAIDNPGMNDLLANGKVDMAFGTLADHVLLKASGYKIKVFGIIDYSISDVLVGLPELKSLKDLKGKTIGIGETNSFSEFFVLSLLKSKGISETEIYFKILPFYQITESLKKGLIHAGHTWDPERTKAIKSGFKVLETSKSMKGIVTETIAVRDEVNNPIVMSDWLESFFEATVLMQNDPEAVAPLIAEFYQTDVRDVVDFIKIGAEMTLLKENFQALKGGHDLSSADYFVRTISEFYHNRGQINKPIALVDVFDDRALLLLSSRGLQ